MSPHASFSTNQHPFQGVPPAPTPTPLPQFREFRRPLSDNELYDYCFYFSHPFGLTRASCRSYFLPSRAEGLNDVLLHLDVRSPASLITPDRLAIVWAITRLRHTLIASRIILPPGQYDKAYFSYIPPSNPTHALNEAKLTFSVYRDRTIDQHIESFMNDKRPHLSWDQLSSYAFIPPSHPVDASSSKVEDFTLIFCAKHCIGDGISMHHVMAEFLATLGGLDGTTGAHRTMAQLTELLDHEWSRRWASQTVLGFEPVTSPTEARMPSANSRLQAAAHKVEFLKNQETFIGGHTIPRARAATFKNVSPDITYDRRQTAAIVAKCKARGVTVSNTLFVLCNFAWTRTIRARALLGDRSFAPETLPVMMYTAVNLRPYSSNERVALPGSYFFLSLTYFNVVLPSFLPSASSLASTFWHRSRSVRAQQKKYLKSPMLIGRTQTMNLERGARSRVWAKEDDDILAGVSTTPSPPAVAVAPKPDPTLTPAAPAAASAPPWSLPPPPTMALVGLTLLGDLDDIYPAAAYPDFEFGRIASFTRKTKGKMLLLAHTFRGKFFIQLGWDVNGFREGLVEEFWARILNGVDEFLLDQDPVLARL
ncbi:hypothetical protein BS47DRAFT_1333650 [Hydnum rufescens UP504]|uniref:Uncharacterized protein n=1 Tax=Hydnum rufescens UP504 TaxID=1448309 RepID=A0A9P6AJK3_9AGAM|nr:hypothetical protein BS47DRAFT_1333650 [Hydnum rufescens UP504]